MNNEDIYKARKKYKKYLKEKEELLLMKEELEELKNNPIVKRYLELKASEYKEILSEKQMMAYSFAPSKTCCFYLPKDSKIYIYMGAYKNHGTYDSRSDIKIDDKEWEYADYLLYTNIDSDIDSEIVRPKYREQFENKYTVLKFSNTINIQTKYNNLQQFYFSQLLNIDLRKKGTVLTLLKEKIDNKQN